MVKVKWEDYDGVQCHRECNDLWSAMELSKHLKDCANIVADIVDNEVVYVGAMGANIVASGKLPDGDNYLWYKRRPDPKK